MICPIQNLNRLINICAFARAFVESMSMKGPVRSEAIKVCVRIRPLAPFEDGHEICATASSDSTVEVR